jgi:hypothetical protein
MTLDHILATVQASSLWEQALLATLLLVALLVLGLRPGLRRALWRAALRPGVRHARELDWKALAKA